MSKAQSRSKQNKGRGRSRSLLSHSLTALAFLLIGIGIGAGGYTLVDQPSSEADVLPTRAALGATAVPTAVVNVETANLREGPGTNYNRAGTATAGTALDIIARTDDSDWYLVEQGNGEPAWIWSGIVNVSTASSEIQVVATIPPTPVSAAAQAACSPSNTQLSAGSTAMVNVGTGSMLTVIANHSWAFTDVSLWPGTLVNIISGPYCRNGMVYWQVTVDPNHPDNASRVMRPGSTGDIWTSTEPVTSLVNGYLVEYVENGWRSLLPR